MASLTSLIKPDDEYNRKVITVIEGLRAGRTAEEIIRFLGYPEDLVKSIAKDYKVTFAIIL